MQLKDRGLRKIALILFLFLSVQLSGLTCIQDLWAYSIWNNGPASPSILAKDVSTDASPYSPASGPQSLTHDCPCHYLVTHLSGFTLPSTPFTGTLVIPSGSRVEDNLPQNIFRPPVVLS